MRKVSAFITRGHEYLGSRKRIDCNDKDIVEKVWVNDLHKLSDTKLYSGCYIKRWYHFKPKLRLMVTDGVVKVKNEG